MTHLIRLLVLSCISMGTISCDDKPDAATSPAAQPAPAPFKEKEQLPEPEYEIAIVESTTEPKTYTVTWSAKVNSGGWSMKTESVLVEDQLGKLAARVWVTLEEPNPADTVTQAMETLTGKYDAGDKKIERMEFSRRRMVKGVKSEWAPTYWIAKTIKYPY